MKKFKSEAELAAQIVEWLGDRYEVFQEVQYGRCGPVADIVARSGQIIWVIETKMTLGLSVLGQADDWRPYAHYVSIATPFRKPSRDRGVVNRLFKMTGIGLLYGNSPRVTDKVEQIYAPRLNRRLVGKLGEYLVEAQKTYAPAGNAESLRWTPWRQTCDNLRQAVLKRPGIPFKELVEGLDHHYATVANARTSLRHWIAEGKVEGVRLEKDGRYLRAYPSEEGKPAFLVHDRQLKMLENALNCGGRP